MTSYVQWKNTIKNKIEYTVTLYMMRCKIIDRLCTQNILCCTRYSFNPFYFNTPRISSYVQSLLQNTHAHSFYQKSQDNHVPAFDEISIPFLTTFQTMCAHPKHYGVWFELATEWLLVHPWYLSLISLGQKYNSWPLHQHGLPRYLLKESVGL